MLTVQKAQKRLAFFKVADWKHRRVEQMANLPEGLKEIGLGILGNYSILSIQVILDKAKDLGINLLAQIKDNNEVADYIVVYQVQQAAIKALVTLDPAERIQIFRVLFPRFFSYVEGAWQLLDRFPYQLGIERKSFRIKHHPEIHNSVRSQWLSALLSTVVDYEQDLPWLAAWANYINYYTEPLGILFAAAIDTEDEVGAEVFDILVASAKGEHEIGKMGHHVTRALLVASRQDGWEFIENLLLTSQRQEDYRQVILETIDEAHPEAFKRMLRVIIERDLTRFSATVRAASLWLGLNWEAVDSKLVKESLKTVLYFLENPNELKTIVEMYPLNVETQDIASLPPAEILYLSLWSMGFQDAFTAIPIAANLLYHHCVEYRLVATYFLSQLGLSQAHNVLLSALTDEDLRIVTLAMRGLTQPSVNPQEIILFAHLEQQLPRFPKKPQVLPTLVWDWLKIKTSSSEVASILYDSLGGRSPRYLIPYLSLLSVYQRRNLAEKLASLQPWDEEIRNTLFALVGDSSQWVREQVIDTLKLHQVTHSEAILLLSLLTRRSGDLRQGILQLLLNQEDAAVLTSAESLLNSKNNLQRRAGLELCWELKQHKRAIEQCSALVQSYLCLGKTLTEAETQIIENILEVVDSEATLENALLLINPQQLTPIESPSVEKEHNFVSEAAKECLRSLDELIHQHYQTPVTITTWQGEQEELFGNINWQFPHFDREPTVEEIRALLPLREVWQTWYENRSDSLRDADGLELVRAVVSSFRRNHFENSGIFDNLKVHQTTWWQQTSRTLFIDTVELQYPIVSQNLLIWLLYLDPPQNGVDFILDGVATTLLLIPFAEIVSERNLAHLSWQMESSLLGWLNFARIHRSYFAELWTPRQQIRYWQLLRWLDRFSIYPKIALEDVMLVYSLGGATQADVIAYILGERSSEPLPRNDFRDLYTITGRKLPPLLAQYPILKEIGDRCRSRILEIELQRGDLPTVASLAALSLQSLSGVADVLKLLQALGKEKFVRGYAHDNLSRAAVFSHLVRVSFPSETETPEDFAKQVQTTQISHTKLIEFAFYAPQWTNYVEKALNWKDFAEAVWWLHTHSKDDRWQVTQEVRETWAAQSSEKTPLAAQSLIDGAVDVAWFRRIYSSLDAEKWQKLNKAAKYASSGSGHKRAQLFADAMLGRIDQKILIDRIDEKRHQDSVRALGLLPLAQGRQRDSDLLNRYKILQDFSRKSRQSGSSRQVGERLAATIGLENLARTAGYTDPQRLEWAMEASAIADLIHHPLTVVIDEMSVSLSISPQGEPRLDVIKNGKALKSIPAFLKGDPKITELKTRRQEIIRQASRMRLSLEEAMLRGDQFTAAELKQLYSHPLLKPMLEQLLFVCGGEIGYPVAGGTALRGYDGKIVAIRSQFLQIAHVYDLSITEQLSLWQGECFTQGRIQPFKQVFRELYLLTAAERKEEKFSRRYEGYQVNPKQALALLGQKGWVIHPEQGVKKTFHSANISAWITFAYGFYTPLNAEGLTINTISFTRRGESVVLPLAEISPRLFSEVMRDLDLVVSVAYQGGGEPQASASTIEMRSALVRETCRLLQYDNVQLQGERASIEGQLSQYSVHLGSAVVHRQPGEVLCIIPYPSPHHGRLFLPFADDDPKTAEVLAKVILLARDGEIEAPSL